LVTLIFRGTSKEGAARYVSFYALAWYSCQGVIDPFALFEKRIKDSLMKQLVKKSIAKEPHRETGSVIQVGYQCS